MSKKEKDGGKLDRKTYEKALRELQEELCYLQAWVKEKGERIIIVLEGRDAAGKGGTIKALTERVSPRVFRVMALPAPSDREKTQMYMQRYMERFPAAGADRRKAAEEYRDAMRELMNKFPDMTFKRNSQRWTRELLNLIVQ